MRRACRSILCRITSPSPAAAPCAACISRIPGRRASWCRSGRARCGTSPWTSAASPTFRRWYGVALSAENKRQLYVPPGFAHGFVVVSETALFHYKCTTAYSPRDEQGFRWDDPAIGIQWPVSNPILSPRDAASPLFSALPADQLF